MSDATTVTPLKYRAFISYSHADKEWGDWLHKALEHYRIPAKLVGMPTASAGPVPKRLYPIFRDREELPTSADLGGQITAALTASQFLIVIASPRSAKSRWVNEEVLAFKRLGREANILPIIVDGEPNAAGKPGFHPDTECFCPALKFAIRPDGTLSDTPFEPICADARPQGDGKPNALLKLVAGLLNVGFDALKQRDAEAARRRIIVRTSIGVLSAALVVGGGTWLAVTQRIAAEDRSSALARLAEAALMRGDAAAAARYALAGGARANGGLLTPDTAGADLALRAAALGLRWRGPAFAHKEYAFAAYAPDSRRVLTWSQDGVARLWDVASGAQVGADMLQDSPVIFATVAEGGGRILTVTADGRIALWDAASGAPVGDAVALGMPTMEAKVSPDGTRLLVQVHNDVYDAKRMTGLRLLDAQTLAPVGEPLPYPPGPAAMAFAPDGRRFLAVARDPATSRLGVLLADAGSGAFIAFLTLTGDAARAIFSADGSRLIAADDDGGLGIWNAADGTAIATGLVAAARVENYLGDVVVALDVSPDGKQVMTAGSDGSARFWSLADGKPGDKSLNLGNLPVAARFAGNDAVLAVLANGRSFIRSIIDPALPAVEFRSDEGIASADLVAGGTRVLSKPRLQFAAESGSVSLWDAATGDRIGLPVPTAPDALALAAPDGATFLAVERSQQAGGQAVRLWRFDVGPAVSALSHFHRRPNLKDAEIAPDGSAILAYGGGGVSLWDVHSGAERVLALEDPEGAARATYSPDGRTLMVVQNGSMRLYDTATGQQRGSAIAHAGGIKDARFSPDGTRIVVGSEDGTARVIDVSAVAFVGPAIAPGGPLVNVWFAGRDHARILTLGKSAQLWDPATGAAVGAPIERMGQRIDANLSPDGTRLILTRPNSDARIWNVETGEELNWPVRHPDKVYLGRFSPDGRTIVTVANDSAARLWSTETASAIGEPMRHREPIKAAVFSPDSAFLLTASRDGTARLWDVATATPVGPVMRSSGSDGFIAADFSAAGDRIITATEDGTVTLWDVSALRPSVDAATDDACRVLVPAGQSALTADELRAAPFLNPESDADPCRSQSAWRKIFGWL